MIYSGISFIHLHTFYTQWQSNLTVITRMNKVVLYYKLGINMHAAYVILCPEHEGVICSVCCSNETRVYAITPRLTHASGRKDIMNVPTQLRVMLESGFELKTRDTFVFKEDPIVERIEPQQSIVRYLLGGERWSRGRAPDCQSMGQWFYLRPFRNLGLCLSEETLKAGGPFYLVSTPGEVNDPTQG